MAKRLTTHHSPLTSVRLEQAAAALAVALAVARPAFPSEDADEGSGLVVISLWGVVAVLWAAAQAARGQLRWFAAPVDLCVVVLVAAVVLAASLADHRRPAINMACEWIGLSLSYFLSRQLFRDGTSQRLLVVAMLATAFILAALGIQQSFWGLEADREAYRQNRLGVLAELGIAPDSPAEEQFRNRLMSHEPFATFALANSLAGFLLAWLPIGLAWLAANRPAHAATLPAVVVWCLAALAVVVTLICLLLTQSRTAYAGLAVALGGLAACYVVPWLRRGSDRSRRWRLAIGGVLVAGVCVAIALAAARHWAKLDEKLVTEATKSLGYRWQYWQATVRLIADRPWAGTGPGNFRSYYLQYKLPESSEEIADPHNMLLDVWATSGVVAAAALVAWLAWSLVRVIRAAGGVAEADVSASWLGLGLSGLGGLLLASLLAPAAPGRYPALMALWAGAAAALTACSPRGAVSARVLGCAALGLVVHLLGAGGIAMPGVAQSLWLLVAVGLNRAEGAREPTLTAGRAAGYRVALAATAACIAFGLLVLLPVTASRGELSLGRIGLADGSLGRAERHLREAARRDPLAVEPWLELARIHYTRWRLENDPEQFGRTVQSLETALRLAPRHLEPHSRLGNLWAARAAEEKQNVPGRSPSSARPWDRAIAAFEQCVSLYPTSTPLRAQFADALWQAGRQDAARRQMQQALDLDAQTPHADKKLRDEERERIRSRLAESAGEGATALP